MTTLIRITLKNGKPTHDGAEVLLGTLQGIILASKGEGGSVLMHREHLKLVTHEDAENFE